MHLPKHTLSARNSHLTNRPEKQAKADKFPNKKIMENEYQYLIDCSGWQEK